ncbi:hypothetical protein PV433_09355 [Paenibacillus sp. GYB004]
MPKNHPSPEAMKNLYKFINRVLPKYADKILEARAQREEAQGNEQKLA